MKRFTLKAYLSDKLVDFVILGVATMIAVSFCVAFRFKIETIMVVILPILAAIITIYGHDYYRRKRFYEILRINLEKLDQAYLITETIPRPEFLDGEILHDTCYETDKSMLENIGKLAKTNQDFREYIELWIHEVKSPLTALGLIANRLERSELTQELTRVDNLVEQVLYFMRAENPEQDYRLGECNIGEIVKVVLQNYRMQIQLQKVEIETKNLNQIVYSDAKWLQFIIGQILANSLKYGAKAISIEVKQGANVKILKIRDDGIGIPEEDLPRVFDKTFTGKNGHGQTGEQSTGMGLYLVKTLCDKLGHRVQIDSRTGKNSRTEVEIDFGEHDYCKNVC